MGTSPYRVAAERSDQEDSTKNIHDRELLPLLAVLWIGSVMRVVVGLMHHETFGQKPTLAFLITLLLPVLGKDELRSLMKRRRERARHPRPGSRECP